MATYTLPSVTFDTLGEIALDYKLYQVNQARAAQTPPLTALTKQQWLNTLPAGWPAQFTAEVKNDFIQRCNVAMQASGDITKLGTVATTLGIDANPYD